MQVHQQQVYQQLVADVVINRHHQYPRRRSPLTVVIMALPRLDLNFKKRAVSEIWFGLRDGGGSRDGIRTVEAGYRAVAHQTVMSCRAERPIRDDIKSNELMFCGK